MTVQELIERLKQFRADGVVWIWQRSNCGWQMIEVEGATEQDGSFAMLLVTGPFQRDEPPPPA